MDQIAPKSDESQPTIDNVGLIENGKESRLENIENNEEPLVNEKNDDKDYQQVVEVDDETTMEEEEALPELEDPLREIRFLEEESNMPLHELMVMYGYSNNTHSEAHLKKKKKKKKKRSSKKSKDKIRKKIVSISTSSDAVSKKKRLSTKGQEDSDKVQNNAGSVSSHNISEEIKGNENVKDGKDSDAASKLLNLYMAEIDPSQSEDDDEDYKPPEWELHWKSVNVGLNFQALVTDGLSAYGDVLPYENNDELLWDPNVLGEDLIEDYLMKIQQITKALKPKSKIVDVRDNEKALYLLVQCGHDVAEALRRMSLNVIPMEKSLSVWSEDETLKFEMGLLINGKNFHAIQKEVKTRSVAELVHFYYFWKKSERYDQFERRQISMRPETKQWQHWESEEDQDSDYDNMFRENSQDDSEDSLNAAENKEQMKCLIYADRKRQVRKKATNNACSNTNTN